MAKISNNMISPVCLNCSRLFNENDFYQFKNGEYLNYCKDCCEELICDDDGNPNIDRCNLFLKKINKAFYYDIWKEAQKEGQNISLEYLNLLDSKKLSNKKYKDSDSMYNNEDLKVDKEALEKWGVSNMEDVDFLEKEYHEWETSYEIDSKAMVDSVMQLCLVDLDIRKNRQKNDVMALDKLLRIKSQILGDANLKPVQETGNAMNEQITIGTLIKKFEQERPIPEIKEPDWIDEMKVWIVGQLARMEGLQSEVTEDFNKELEKYGVETEISRLEDGDS